MNAFTEEVVLQQSKIIEEITQVIQLEKTIDESAVWQGKWIASLKDKDAHIQYGQTWKHFALTTSMWTIARLIGASGHISGTLYTVSTWSDWDISRIAIWTSCMTYRKMSMPKIQL
jgi:hypothetical protein